MTETGEVSITEVTGEDSGIVGWHRGPNMTVHHSLRK